MTPALVVTVVAIYTAEALETEKEPDWEMCRKLYHKK